MPRGAVVTIKAKDWSTDFITVRPSEQDPIVLAPAQAVRVDLAPDETMTVGSEAIGPLGVMTVKVEDWSNEAVVLEGFGGSRLIRPSESFRVEGYNVMDIRQAEDYDYSGEGPPEPPEEP